MKVYQGQSSNTSGRAAVEEATRSFDPALKPDLVIVFASTKQDPDEVIAAVNARFPGAAVAGCTTAGEHCEEKHATGSLVVSAIQSPEIRWSVRAVRGLAALDATKAQASADELFAGLGVSRDSVDPSRQFCLTFIDGLSMKEEHVVSLMADALEGLPLLGGSSGDDLGFKQTRIFVGAEAISDAAVFILADSKRPYTIVKHQHYTTSPRSVVITKADVSQRRVYEMDGYPALEAYARALGMKPAEVTGDVCFMNPLTLQYNGEIYVRSIQRIEPSDGSIIFYCGIEEGMVLSIGGHEPMTGALERDLKAMESKEGPADLFIACNCILRSLEADKRSLYDDLGGILFKTAKHVVGFDTYGEQLNGLHINQTLVGIALRGDAKETGKEVQS